MALPIVDVPSSLTGNSSELPASGTSEHGAALPFSFTTSVQVQSDPRSTSSETTCPSQTKNSDYGPTPFDESSDGDCIIKASDGVKYKLYRVILRLASPVWKDMFDVPQPGAEGGSSGSEPQDLPIIEVTEPSTTLLPLFRLLYPISKDQIPKFDLALDLVLVHDKYDIDVSGLVPYLADLFSEASLQKQALEAYGLAWRLKKGPLVETASRHLHQVELEKTETKDKLLHYSGDFGSLLALHELRYRRELALDDLILSLPLQDYRCAQHANLSAIEAKKLRGSVRKALESANPQCWDLVQFLDLRNVFTLVAPPVRLPAPANNGASPASTGSSGGTTSGTTVPGANSFGGVTFGTAAPTASTFGATTQSFGLFGQVGSASAPRAVKPLKPLTCSDCEDTLKQPKSESNRELVYRVSRFPQAVTWNHKN